MHRIIQSVVADTKPQQLFALRVVGGNCPSAPLHLWCPDYGLLCAETDVIVRLYPSKPCFAGLSVGSFIMMIIIIIAIIALEGAS